MILIWSDDERDIIESSGELVVCVFCSDAEELIDDWVPSIGV